MIVKSQNMLDTIPLSRILRTKIDRKEDCVWLVTATVEGENRAIVLGRYPSEKEAIIAEMHMWLTDAMENEQVYYFPAMSFKTTEEIIEWINSLKGES